MTAPATLGWWQAGEAFAAATVAGLADTDLDGPSLLPGWSRRTVVAHLAGNADALVNLMTWAATGVETPMYASPEARQRGIDQIAALPAADLRARLDAATARLAGAFGNATAAVWDASIRTNQGATVRADRVPWMRCVEAWVHTVDLDAGPDFTAVPEEILLALIDGVVATFTERGDALQVTLRAGDRSWGTGPTVVSGTPAGIAAIVTGRATAPDGAAVPRWI